MRTESGHQRQDAFLCPCPHCAAHNALNAARCWRCEEELPPPSADALIAAYAALAAARESRRAMTARLPDGWRVYDGPSRSRAWRKPLAGTNDGAAGGAPARATARAGSKASIDPAAEAPHPVANPDPPISGSSAVAPAQARFQPPDGEPGPPFLRTIAMGDEEDDDADLLAAHPAPSARLPRLDAGDEEAMALARQAAVSERFGAFVGRDEAASRRRHLFALIVAVLGTVLILAGYPIYRSAERSLGAEDLRRTPPPPGWPPTPATTPQRSPSPAPLMTHDGPLPVSRTASVPARDIEGAPLQPTPVQAGPVEHLGAAVPVPVPALAGAPVQRAARAPVRSNLSVAARGGHTAGSGSARSGHPPRVAHAPRSDRRRTASAWVMPPATSREIAALASGR